ncbi:unannotated protein [freshwater metagenome]|uniref:Unannotated protein n=1 Tax=freshwater metagenome TaxID=449393 RepID=A0A6J7F6J3_9ZZZZ|nr:hypothetical protein [Actinomycetota bacterium]
MTITPNSDVAVGATVSVSATGIISSVTNLPFSGSVVLVQCGNATTDGTPLTSISQIDCDGINQIANIVFGFASSGEVAATDFPTRTSGIGDNARQCLPTPPATLPCGIGLADPVTTGATVQLAGTYTLPADPNASTTTIGDGSTTTVAGGSTTTVAGVTTTTVTAAVATTTTARAAVVTTTTTALGGKPIPNTGTNPWPLALAAAAVFQFGLLLVLALRDPTQRWVS